MSKLIGKWQFDSGENIEGGLKAIGAPEDLVAKLAAGKPNFEFSKDGDTWSVKLVMGDVVREHSFKCGEEFETKSYGGLAVKSTVTIDGDVLTELQKLENGKEVKLVRTADDSSLTGEMFVEDQKTTMKFKRA